MKYLELNPDKLEQALRQASTHKNNGIVFGDNDFTTNDRIKELVQLASQLQDIPTQEVFRPIRKYKFQEVGQTNSLLSWQGLVSNLRLAVIPLGLVLILGGGLVAQATEKSLPGDTLYSIKRATEEARLSLTLDEEKVAHLHIAYAQKRLAEVKEAIKSNNSESETLAIAALKEQTEKAFAEVSDIAVSNAVTKNDQSLIENLAAINKDQKEILSTIIEELPGTKEATEVAMNSTHENDKTLAKIIASVTEQTVVESPNKVSVTGIVKSVADNEVVVEDTTFVLNTETGFVNGEGESIEPQQLTADSKISVVGTKTEQNIIIANQIQILAKPVTEPIEPEPTPINNTPVVKGIITTKPSVTVKPVTEPIEPTPEPIVTPENQATAGFIVEPSERQYTE